MKKIFIASVCTLGLTLLGAIGNYQNAQAISDEFSVDRFTTDIEQNVTNNNNASSLFRAKTMSIAQSSNSETNKNKEVKVVSTVEPNRVYKNVDLSNCKSQEDVIKTLKENGVKGITASNINEIKGLENILAYINKYCKNNTEVTPTKAPVSNDTPTPTKAPVSNDTPTPTKAPVSNDTPTPTKAPVSNDTPTPTKVPVSNDTGTPTKPPVSNDTPTPTKAPTSDLSSYADQVLKLVNEERAKEGLPALTTNKTLQSAANKRAQEIVQTFSHTRPNGTSCFTVLDEFGISYRSAGENIAYGQKTPEAVMNAWMNSSGHRANILKAGFGKVGIGVYKVNGVLYWTQVFTN